ncbi:hypothetical protein [Halorussus aquaticus]|uniref:Major facilitator superfamily (MFS) profile domain-containing protein n=1 Tax=Halorussus aquaticus TaxID=2953748 RepID=A0ABD5PXR6_9EURY|nr:hypothetical protein [Halorussus aquaticus]
MVFKSLVTGGKALAATVGGFFAGSLGWSAVSGILAGALDSFGIVTPASAWLAVSPFVGLVVAGAAVTRVT